MKKSFKKNPCKKSRFFLFHSHERSELRAHRNFQKNLKIGVGHFFVAICNILQ